MGISKYKLAAAFAALLLSAISPSEARPVTLLNTSQIAVRQYGGDAPWYIENIPFFECSDQEITDDYYYRWKLYKSHLRDIGDRGYIVTEFLDDVSWSIKPYESLNDATGFHINEGRWLRDGRYVDDYIEFMHHGGNDRHFSEAIASAAYDRYLVDGDAAFAIKHLDEMKRIYRLWDDHFDVSKGLYYIEPLLDATEYTISSVDASGGKDGFRGGSAFRPSINSFMYANAVAISQLSKLAGDLASAKEFADKAVTLRDIVQRELWNDEFQHFVDRYQANNNFVHYWDFIRGRELAGYTPWYYDLPESDPKYVASWGHILATDQLGGKFGIRTVEPTYQYYMRQYRYAKEDGVQKRECQWNGPSWPFQTTFALGGLANLLNDYPAQHVIGVDDYVRLLRQYARQHYDHGKLDLQEDYDPDSGDVIVGLHRSHNYNHSGFNDLVITGFAGLRPRADDKLVVNPLIATGGDQPIGYMCLEGVSYHGHSLTIVYDRDGSRYHVGTGLTVFVDGKAVVKKVPLGRVSVTLPKAPVPEATAKPSLANLAVNVRRRGFPAPSASVNSDPAALYRAVDGRVWFYPDVPNYWTTKGSPNSADWYGIDFGAATEVSSVSLYFYGDGAKFKAPTAVKLQDWNGADWIDVAGAKPAHPIENGETVISFAPVQTSQLRAVLTAATGAFVALVEIKAYGTQVVAQPAAVHAAG